MGDIYSELLATFRHLGGGMLMNRLMPILVLLLALASTTARAFFDPPYVTPASPTPGETVWVNIYAGPCDGIIQMAGYPKVTQQDRAIRILLFGVKNTCNYSTPGTATIQVGAYSAGAYTLQVDLLYDNWPFGYAVETLGIVPFTVANSPALAVPTPVNSPLALAGLILIILGLTAFALRTRRTSVLLIVLACAPFGVRAKIAADHHTIEISLTNASGAPTPAQIVDSHTASQP